MKYLQQFLNTIAITTLWLSRDTDNYILGVMLVVVGIAALVSNLLLAQYLDNQQKNRH